MDTSREKHLNFFSIFIFPFKYFHWDGNREAELTPREATQLLVYPSDDESKGWTIREFNFENDGVEHYSQWHYFHPYVRSMIFSKPLQTHREEGSPKESIVYLTRKDFDSLQVDYFDKEGILKSIRTDVMSIDVHLFDNQIGILSITTERARNQPYTFDDFLKFNDIARRVYPPHLREDSGGSNTEYAKRQSRLLPNAVILSSSSGKRVSECFNAIELPRGFDYLSNVIQSLLLNLQPAPHLQERVAGKSYFQSFTDDRMFVVSYCPDAKLAAKLSRVCCGEFGYERSDEWYRFLYVDGGGPGIANDLMKKQLIRSNTYARWAQYGSLYGLTRYSLVLLCDGGIDYLYDHMKGIYYQMALVVLFQRCMLLKFSQDVKELTHFFPRGSENLDIDKFREKASKLQADFIEFTNKYWYTEVTPQEQGVEMYKQWMQLLDHEYLYGKVRSEINEMASYIRTEIEHKTSRQLAIITAVGLPISAAVMMGTIWLVLYGEEIHKTTHLGWLQFGVYLAFLIASWLATCFVVGWSAMALWDWRKFLHRFIKKHFLRK